MKVIFTDLARLELLDAIDYYELEFLGKEQVLLSTYFCPALLV